MKYTIIDLQNELLQLKGMYGIYCNEDVVINKDLKIYMKPRLVNIAKPRITPDERVLISCVDLVKVSPTLLMEATAHIFAVKDVKFNSKPENLNKYENPNVYKLCVDNYNKEVEGFQTKYRKEILEHVQVIKGEIIRILVAEINTPKLRQILWSLGYKDADSITSLDVSSDD